MSIDEEKLKMWCKRVDKRLDQLEGKGALIPDTECRKIMRLWADRCGIKSVMMFASSFTHGGKSIDFGVDFGLEHPKLYTIAELCGDSKEDE